ncbi:efflux RND transporter periplasmic adaptor subunit [Pseudooceanicola nanhaiensis]|uniref:efflux RND transporter periplasmic adaptor subunit n=1 Tax=Pseudooceanicola nanhaiensis TaxID=375761 RepID=UPI001CD811B4|nr:efflux RND transporter periplasmic adaptor subunit [Pseudooceanicola nanhaiensis]MCA0919583.1 efflux RND transporter periplasmic adaptor subunit [Pseudooceanicola nanhaiensis]
MIRLPLLTLLVLAAPVLRAESFDCLMDPSDLIELGSPATGLLDAVTVDRGDTVQAGQEVARLVSEIEQSTVDLLRLRAENDTVVRSQAEQLEMIEKRFERVSAMRGRGLTTEEVFNQVEGELIASRGLLAQAELNQEIAVKELARAEIALAQRRITSPVDGVVAKRVMGPGEYISNDDHVLEIVQLDPLKIEAFLPVSLYAEVRVGDAATIRPVAPLDGAYAATVTAVDRVFDAASGTFVIELQLPNADGALPAGHRCRLEFGAG